MTNAAISDLAGSRSLPERSVLAHRLDALAISPTHIVIVGICAIAFGFDLSEVAIGSALSAVFSAPPAAADPSALSWLLSSMYVGAIVGAPAFGWLADRRGRRIALALALMVLALTSLAGALSAGIASLTVFRGLSGIALGAFPPLVFAYLTDLLPARRRGLMIFAMSGLASLGPIGIIFLIRWLTPLQPLGFDAWRWAMLVGAGGALATGVLFLTLLPESPRWLLARGRTSEAGSVLTRLGAANPGADLVLDRPVAPIATERASARPSLFRRLAVIFGLNFLSPWATTAFPLLSGAALIQKGFQLSDSLLYVGVSLFGPVIGTVIAAIYVDRIERRAAIVGCAVAMLLSGTSFVLSMSPIWLMASGVSFGVFASLLLPTLTVYAAEMFPTVDRGWTTSAGWAVNRTGSVIALLLLLPVLHLAGPLAMFTVIGGSLILIVVLVTTAGPPGRSGRAVD